MPGSGAMGSNIGNLEFDSQTNNNSDCVPEADRFKFVDDLSILEVINLINIGISSFNVRQQVPNDLPEHGQFVDNLELKSQAYLNKINRWTENQQRILSEKNPRLWSYILQKTFSSTPDSNLKDKMLKKLTK